MREGWTPGRAPGRPGARETGWSDAACGLPGTRGTFSERVRHASTTHSGVEVYIWNSSVCLGAAACNAGGRPVRVDNSQLGIGRFRLESWQRLPIKVNLFLEESRQPRPPPPPPGAQVPCRRDQAEAGALSGPRAAPLVWLPTPEPTGTRRWAAGASRTKPGPGPLRSVGNCFSLVCVLKFL